MRKLFHLANCGTCQRIIKETKVDTKKVTLSNIKIEPIEAKELVEMKKLAGSYEALFSRRAMKYRSLGLNEMDLKESDYKKWILKEYTFLKRPVLVYDDHIFIGNTKKVVEASKEFLAKKK